MLCTIIRQRTSDRMGWRLQRHRHGPARRAVSLSVLPAKV